MQRDRKKKLAGRKRARNTGLLLVALVIVPGLILGWMAIQAADREEAVIEKQLRTALLAEITPAADRISLLLRSLQTDLDATAPNLSTPNEFALPGPGRRVPTLDGWAASSSAVGIPFVFQREKGRFLWPEQGSSALSEAESEFLELNLDFFQDRKSVEVLQNLAVQYADRSDDLDGLTLEEEPESKAERRQQALSEFERNEDFRNRLYDEAAKSGKKVPPRTDSRSKGSKVETAEQVSAPSPFVTESLRFSQILGDAEQGWIPRLIDDRVLLLFWKRSGEDRILGCTLDENTLRERILEVLPTALNQARLLTVLDHTGRPLFDPSPETARDWRASFVSREISEFLPRWEVAAYLADPEVITDRARTRALTIGLLVGVLVISIMTGGLVVSRTLRSELRLAEQKTTFVANVSHELKTPLTSIRLLSEMLRDGRQKDESKQRKYLDIVVSETERLTRLINNVLDFSRIDREGRQYSRRSIDLAELCREIVETQMVRLTHSGFTVESSLGAEDAWATVDPEAIKQALLNLVSNAEKYSPDEKWIRVSLRRDGDTAVLSVADHGMGIRPGDAGHIFDEFYRADDTLTANVRGTGLGLTLSRGIVEDHGGQLVYTPNHPRGSVFEVQLPLEEPSPLGAFVMNEHILVVEDDPAILTGLVDLLEGEGYRVTSATDGLEAVRLFEAERPDLALLDVMIPGQSGYDVCRQIRSKDTRTPVLMLTAKGQEVDKVVGLELGADDYIVKPFGLQELLARVRAALRRSRNAAAAVAEAADEASGGGVTGTGTEAESSDTSAANEDIRFGEVEVHPKSLELTRAGRTIPITKRELSLLQEFVGHDGEVLDRSDLLERIWGVRYEGTTRTLDQHIAKLRQKVESDPAHPRHIRTVHGVGYRFFSDPGPE